jgi:hypothetical protein
MFLFVRGKSSAADRQMRRGDNVTFVSFRFAMMLDFFGAIIRDPRRVRLVASGLGGA